MASFATGPGWLRSRRVAGPGICELRGGDRERFGIQGGSERRQGGDAEPPEDEREGSGAGEVDDEGEPDERRSSEAALGREGLLMICLRAIDPQDPQAMAHELRLLPDLIVGHEELPKLMGVPVYRLYWGLPGGTMVMQCVVRDTWDEIEAKVRAARRVESSG